MAKNQRNQPLNHRQKNSNVGFAAKDITARGITMTVYNTNDIILSRLDRVKNNGNNKWIARCPAHDDRNPSLSIKYDGNKILLYCFAGCTTNDVLASIGLTFKDLFAETLSPDVAREYKSKKLNKLISDETTVLLVARGSIDNGFFLSATDMERIVLANHRIATAKEQRNGI